MITRRSLRSLSNKAEDEPKKKKETSNTTDQKETKSIFESNDTSSNDSNDSEEEFVPKQKTSKTVSRSRKRPKGKSSSESSSSSSEIDVIPVKNRKNVKNPVKIKAKDTGDSNEGSSSDSSVGNYLKNPDEIDLNSTFFNCNSEEKTDFDAIEKNIFNDVQRLSDSESEDTENDVFDYDTKATNSDNLPQTQSSTTKKLNFSQLYEYNKKLEEAKACVQKYVKKVSKAEKKAPKNKNDVAISDLLTIGEAKANESTETLKEASDLDSENEMDWEEIEEDESKSEEIAKIPKEGVQITVELPTVVRKKKGVDFMTAIKRRINRIKKENQVYIHKVHLLCWIAHGNCLNSILNNENLMGLALSLLPSEQCYPPKHADISYLEQILRWYGKMMKLQEKPDNNEVPVLESLQLQISKKQAWSKKDLVLIFIIILRSLGLQCRLVLSLQCLPLRPPNSELCSLNTKEQTKKDSKSENKKVESKASTSRSASVNSKLKSKKLDSKLNVASPKKLPIKKDNSQSSSDNKTNITSLKDQAIKKVDSKISKTSSVSNDLKKKPLFSKLQENVKNAKKIDPKKPNLSKLKSPSQETLDKDAVNKKEASEAENKSKMPKIKISKEKAGTSKTTDKTKISNSKTTTSNKLAINSEGKNEKKGRSRSQNAMETKESKDSKREYKRSTRSKSENSNKTEVEKKETKNTKTKNDAKKQVKVSQVDGADDSDEPSTSKSSKVKKPNLNKLKQTNISASPNNKPKISSRSVKSNIKYRETETTSDDDFQTDSRSSTSSPEKRRKELDKNSNKKKLTNTRKGKRVDVKNDIIDLIKGRMTEQRHVDNKRKIKKRGVKSQSDDSDYAPEPELKKRRSNSDDDFQRKDKTKVKQRVNPKVRFFTDDEDSQDVKKKKGIDIWAEVFLEAEEKWISVDIVKGQVHCVSELYSRASHPVSYILAWNNNLSLKDVTARYCPNWNTVTRKLRVDQKWWNESLRPFIGVKTARDKEEDEDLARQQLDQPLPKSIGEYKNHPLYALKRHLLKFEAIYPPDAVTLGFIRNEAVYARECVHTLHSREIWVKHAKVVKPGEQPYKIVKARPKYDKLSNTLITDKPLEIFGPWQVQDYVPPTAENGIVPRNAFGNVELFKPCMLPKKTVHLQLPGLNKIARKLQIDCASAVVGFDFHCGASHPTFDGFVVCEEFKDTLIAAWEVDQAETAIREQEKYEKRVYGNWRKLIKGLLIRERLKARYDFGDPSTSSDKKEKKSKKCKLVAKKRRVCSDNESHSE